MSNIFQIDEDTLNTLPDDIKQKLKAFQPEDTSGLKNKANELLSEKKRADARAAELEAELAQLRADQKKTKVDNGDENKLADAMARLEQAQAEAAALKQQMAQGRIDAEAQKIVAGLTTDTRRASVLAKEIKNRLQLEGESITVLNKDGKPTISSLDELTNEIKKEYDFLIDGTKASGGGAIGGNGRASNAPNTKRRSEFEAMSQHERAEFSKSGGKIVSDE